MRKHRHLRESSSQTLIKAKESRLCDERSIDRSRVPTFSHRFFIFLFQILHRQARESKKHEEKRIRKKKVISTFPSTALFQYSIQWIEAIRASKTSRKKKRKKKNINFNCGESRSSPLKEYLRISALNRRPPTGLRIHFGDYGKM